MSDYSEMVYGKLQFIPDNCITNCFAASTAIPQTHFQLKHVFQIWFAVEKKYTVNVFICNTQFSLFTITYINF